LPPLFSIAFIDEVDAYAILFGFTFTTVPLDIYIKRVK